MELAVRVEETLDRLETLVVSLVAAAVVLLVLFLLVLDNQVLDNLEQMEILATQEVVVAEHNLVKADNPEDLEMQDLMGMEQIRDNLEITELEQDLEDLEVTDLEHKVETQETQETLEMQTLDNPEVVQIHLPNRLQLVEVQDIQSKLVLEDLLPSLGTLHK